MELTIAPEAFARFPGFRLAVAVAEGIDNQACYPEVEAEWRAAWEAAGAEGAPYGNAQSHPRIIPWREGFRRMGVSGKTFPSSAEALLRRALKGGEPFTINPLVDFYNAVSLRHVAPAGGFDLDDIEHGITLRLTEPGDHFTALDAGEPLELPPGELAYCDGRTVLTRHFVWRQSRKGLITPATTRVVLLSEVLGELPPEAGPAIRDDLAVGLRTHFHAEPSTFLLDEQEPVARW